MKMKRRAIALLLALIMCLSLLSACGADKTEEAAAPESAVDTAGQQEVVKEEPKQEPEQEAPVKTEEPEEEEPEEAAEPEQEEVEEQNSAGTEFLALLQEEYENGFVEGEGPRHTYYEGRGDVPFIYDGVVYIPHMSYNNDMKFGAYDIASKEINVLLDGWIESYIFLDGNFFVWDNRGYSLFDRYSFERVKMIDNDSEDFDGCILFDKGYLFRLKNGSSVLFSYNHEKIAEISVPQREIEHGLIEDMEIDKFHWFAADGTVYTKCKGEASLYRLNTDTYEWENTDNAVSAAFGGKTFFGKYFSSSDGIYDRITGELVFEYGELYKAACHIHDNQCYFGGDKYLGYNGGEYRWVSLTDLSMSDPLPFPESLQVTILNDTYCVYEDQYGWFLWNYNDGTEETIMLYDN